MLASYFVIFGGSIALYINLLKIGANLFVFGFFVGLINHSGCCGSTGFGILGRRVP
jgi:hypothetical protein